MLEIKNVWKTFNKGTVNEKQALCGVNLTLNDGDFCTVIGGNGAGKSTTLNAIAGVWPVDCGQILIDGKDISAMPMYWGKRKYVSLGSTCCLSISRHCAWRIMTCPAGTSHVSMAYPLRQNG